jgi:uncharacterized protein (DUF302 family)/uncharacterized membrane protein YidH (DUF202 family)
MDAADRRSGQISDYLAAERTFLAWIRTGLALMGFGFVVARFGLFLQALQTSHSNYQARPFGPSVWLGTGLIVLGIVVNLLSAWSHIRLAHNLNQGGPVIHGPSTLAVAVAIVLAVLGLAMGIYVVSVNGPHSQPGTDKEEFMAPGTETGMVTIPSRHSVDETVANIEGILAAKGVKLFAVIDHSGEAEKAGLRMPSTKLLIFGNPKVGTPLMLAAPSIAIDLPLKILVAEGPDGRVSISYNAAEYIQARHHLSEELARAYANAGVDVLAGKAAE